MTNCERAIANLYAFLDAELDGVSAQEIRSHVEDCHSCDGPFDFEKKLLGIVKERLTEDPPPEFFDRIKSLLAVETASDT